MFRTPGSATSGSRGEIFFGCAFCWFSFGSLLLCACTAQNIFFLFLLLFCFAFWVLIPYSIRYFLGFQTTAIRVLKLVPAQRPLPNGPCDCAWFQRVFSSLATLASCLHFPTGLCLFPSRRFPMSEPIMELLRDLGGKQTNVLEVMQKQQLEFQRNLATAVGDIRMERDPKFPVWDGDPNSVLLWLYRVEQLKTAYRMSDGHALRAVRTAMGEHGYGHFDEREINTWSDFQQLIRERFLPSDVERKLLSELHTLKMTNGDLNTFFCRFQAFRKQLTSIDAATLIAAFVDGLEPHLQYVVQSASPRTVESAVDIAWKAHNGPKPAWLPYMQSLYQQVQAQTSGQLDHFSQEAARFIQQQLATYQPTVDQRCTWSPATPVTMITAPAASQALVSAPALLQQPTAMQLDTFRPGLPMLLPPNNTRMGPIDYARVQLPPYPSGFSSAFFSPPLEQPSAPLPHSYTSQPRSRSPRAGYQQAHVRPGSRPQSSRCYRCGEAGHFAIHCRQSSQRSSQCYDRSPTPPEPTVCHRCKRVGHVAAHCRQNTPPSVRCSRCNRYGHTSDRCRSPTPERRCTKCNRYGHTAERCRTPSPDKRCSQCNRRGHTAEQCRSPSRDERPKATEGR